MVILILRCFTRITRERFLPPARTTAVPSPGVTHSDLRQRRCSVFCLLSLSISSDHPACQRWRCTVCHRDQEQTRVKSVWNSLLKECLFIFSRLHYPGGLLFMSYQIALVSDPPDSWNDDLLLLRVKNSRCPGSFSIGCRGAGTASCTTGIVLVCMFFREGALSSGDRPSHRAREVCDRYQVCRIRRGAPAS